MLEDHYREFLCLLALLDDAAGRPDVPTATEELEPMSPEEQEALRSLGYVQ